MKMQESWSYSTWCGKCSIHHAICIYTVWLYEILRFDATIFNNVGDLLTYHVTVWGSTTKFFKSSKYTAWLYFRVYLNT